MGTGFLSLILHAHLPFVRHPEFPEYQEEDWLYEAITEVYVPLLSMLFRLRDSGMPPRLVISVSPTLCEMLVDPLLQSRYEQRLQNLIWLTEKEISRTSATAPEFVSAALMYSRTLREVYHFWNGSIHRNILAALSELQRCGILELITCSATHAVLPFVSTREARKAQIKIAVDNFRFHFGQQPRGLWLPECAYEPGIEELLADSGIEYFIVDSHAILYGQPRPKYGVYSPVLCPNGVAAFGRDVKTSQQVWSSIIGYPGHADYREFYRDLGWDAPLEYIRPHLHANAQRRPLGIKYYRITGQDVPQDEKKPYHPEVARSYAAIHAEHFAVERIKQARSLFTLLKGRKPLIVSPYDAELFGHWWYEGVQFLEFFFASLQHKKEVLSSVTPGDYLDSGHLLQTQRLSSSSWGEEGYFKVWLSENNSWMYRHQEAAELRMTSLADSQPGATQPVLERALNQAARELLLAQSSDWAFQIHHGTAVAYAEQRFKSHINRFNILADAIEHETVDSGMLAEIEDRDSIFPHIDYRVFKSSA